jgi:hypothetical protein
MMEEPKTCGRLLLAAHPVAAVAYQTATAVMAQVTGRGASLGREQPRFAEFELAVQKSIERT